AEYPIGARDCNDGRETIRPCGDSVEPTSTPRNRRVVAHKAFRLRGRRADGRFVPTTKRVSLSAEERVKEFATSSSFSRRRRKHRSCPLRPRPPVPRAATPWHTPRWLPGSA